MTLSAGTRLGSYEILAPLGAGGMGEVYRARDARLDRDVAIKVLPERLAGTARESSKFSPLAIPADFHRKKAAKIFQLGTWLGVIEPMAKLLLGARRQRLREAECEDPFRLPR